MTETSNLPEEIKSRRRKCSQRERDKSGAEKQEETRVAEGKREELGRTDQVTQRQLWFRCSRRAEMRVKRSDRNTQRAWKKRRDAKPGEIRLLTAGETEEDRSWQQNSRRRTEERKRENTRGWRTSRGGGKTADLSQKQPGDEEKATAGEKQRGGKETGRRRQKS